MLGIGIGAVVGLAQDVTGWRIDLPSYAIGIMAMLLVPKGREAS